MAEEDMGDDGMVMGCSQHPSKNNPGGICAFCLQEKLGKLVSSFSSVPTNGSTSFSSSSTTFGSEFSYGSSGSRMGSTESTTVSLSARFESKKGWCQGGKNPRHHQAPPRAYTHPFLLAKKKKKLEMGGLLSSSSSSDRDPVLARSKSTMGDRTRTSGNFGNELSPRKRAGLWSLLHFYPSKFTARKRSDASASRTTEAAASVMATSIENCLGTSLLKKGDITVVVEEEEEEEDHTPTSRATTTSYSSSVEQKVSRSRSTGCGNRSFSGDFFDRFSSGFGDCTLRRVESHREGKPKQKPKEKPKQKPKEKPKEKSKVLATGPNSKHGVLCGGLFGGFAITSSSSSSTSSSSLWNSSLADEKNGKSANGKSSRGWSWAFASPMRAISRASSKGGHKSTIREASRNNLAANLSLTPSLLIA